MLEEKVENAIKKYELIKSGDNIVIGVSGGPDSMALLNILIKIKNKDQKIGIVVAHINHMIREEAQEETKYVESFCKNHNIQCFTKMENVIEIAKTEKIGTEEAGRKIRYKFFEEVLEKTNSNKIATAHTANDRAETVLMNIMRGSGTSGLKAIEEKRGDKYIRPLIDCTRQEIEEYCIKEKIEPKYDESNKENIYTRNKVRNLLIPYIEKEFNPNIVETLNRLSKLATIENKYLEKETEKAYREIFLGKQELDGKKEIILDLKKFNNLELVIKNRVILYTINKVIGNAQNIERIHIEDIIKLCSNNIGNKFLTPNKNIKILVNKQKIFFKKLI